MRVVEVDRRLLLAEPLAFPTGEVVDTAAVAAVFDSLRLPDGFPFVVDDDGSPTGCAHLNRYLFDAHEQNGLELQSLRRFHVYHLSRLLRFLRKVRAESRARSAGMPVEEWLAENGEPKVDLTDATRADLTAYRDARQRLVERSSLSTEIGCISGFYRYATSAGWMAADPMPRWAGRSTLAPRHTRRRVSKFLTAGQTSHFLDVGLRGDGALAGQVPAQPERDYVYGLLLASTGLRREECALLLDAEVPPPADMPSDGVHPFPRVGKKDATRTVYLTLAASRAADLYRRTERQQAVAKAQPTLRRAMREGLLHVVDDVVVHRGRAHVIEDGHRVAADRLTDEQRAVAVRVADDGSVQPLGLFLSARGGLPLDLKYWNELFADARDRVFERGGAQRPPEHITVTPHTLRHTFAVRMLHALMREGQERVGNPYYLLANPVLTVMELLGHASLKTTQEYLYAAETWEEDVPSALRSMAASLVGHDKPSPGAEPA